MMVAQAQRVALSGYVREAGSGELLANVAIQITGSKTGTLSNNYGFFSLPVSSGQPVEVIFRLVGFQTRKQSFSPVSERPITIELQPQPINLAEVTVSTEQAQPVSEDSRMSVLSLPIRQLKEIPLLLGEKDVLKALQLMPGVQKGSEGTTGLYVRGGGPDQNLLLLDDAVVYNASHLFGFFSVFNGDALRRVELTKGGFPARFGGRLSSVVEMQMKEGNREKLHGEGGIGVLSGRLTLEGPLRRNKSSFLVSGRRSYADIILRPLSGGEFPAAFFYDLNAKVNVDLGPKDRLYLSGYLGRDVFRFTDNTAGSKREDGFRWGNLTTTLRWNHLFSSKLFANTALILSQYDFTVFNQQNESDGFYSLQYSSGIRDVSAKVDFDYLPGRAHSLKFGGQVTAHRFTPNAVVLKDSRADTSGIQNTPINAVETGFYVEDLWHPTNALTINSGLRFSSFSVDGKVYANLEPRLSASQRLGAHWALKVSYARMNQYVQLLSNSGLGLPTDLWVPSTGRIPPQRADQVAIGIAKDLPRHNLSLTAEAFYKKMNSIVGYREGASFLLLDFGPDAKRTSAVDWQENVTIGQGRAYGAELLVQRKTGRLSGWAGYTLSWIHHRFADLNQGNEFHPRYDRRHDLSVVSIYQLRPRITLSLAFVYGTGNALTIPVARSELNEHTFTNFSGPVSVSQYGQVNSFRAAPYHRLDVGVQFKKPKRWGERQWEISAYNVYNRINPFYYESRSSREGNGQVSTKLYRRGLFPVVPSVSYSFKF